MYAEGKKNSQRNDTGNSRRHERYSYCRRGLEKNLTYITSRYGEDDKRKCKRGKCRIKFSVSAEADNTGETHSIKDQSRYGKKQEKGISGNPVV